MLVVAEMYCVSRFDAAVATISVVIPLKAGNFHVFFALLCATAVHVTIGVLLKCSFCFFVKKAIIATKHIFTAII